MNPTALDRTAALRCRQHLSSKFIKTPQFTVGDSLIDDMLADIIHQQYTPLLKLMETMVMSEHAEKLHHEKHGYDKRFQHCIAWPCLDFHRLLNPDIGDRKIGDWTDSNIIRGATVTLRNLELEWDKCDCPDHKHQVGGWTPVIGNMKGMVELARAGNNDLTWNPTKFEWSPTPLPQCDYWLLEGSVQCVARGNNKFKTVDGNNYCDDHLRRLKADGYPDTSVAVN